MPFRRVAAVAFGIVFVDEKGTRNVRFVLNVHQSSVAQTWRTVLDLIWGLCCVEKRRPLGVAVNIAVFIFSFLECMNLGDLRCVSGRYVVGRGGDDRIGHVLTHRPCQICIRFPTGCLLVHSVDGKYVSWNVGKLPLLYVAELWKSTQRTENQPRNPQALVAENSCWGGELKFLLRSELERDWKNK